MDFNIPEDIGDDAANFGRFLVTHLKPHLSSWYKGGEVPAEFYRQMGGNGWLGIQWQDGGLVKTSTLREALINEELAKLSPGVAIAVLAHVNLGLIGLYLFDWHLTADWRAGGTGQRIDVVLVVPHLQRAWKSTLRHDR